MSVLLPRQPQTLPASLPVVGAVNIVVEDGIPIFRASQNRQGPLVNYKSHIIMLNVGVEVGC